jgi:hypothetical protein
LKAIGWAFSSAAREPAAHSAPANTDPITQYFHALLRISSVLSGAPLVAQASLVQEVTRAETFWSFAHFAARYRLTEAFGKALFSYPERPFCRSTRA